MTTETVDRATGEITTATAHAEAQALPNGQAELQRLLERQPFSVRDMLTHDTLDKVMRLAEVMASSRITVPKHLQGNVGDCAAIIGQAMRWGMDHNAVAQKTHLVNGALGYEAQLIIAALNNSPLLATRLNFEWFGDWTSVNGKEDRSADRGVRVFATLRGEREPRVLEVSMAQVGPVRNSPNWVADPRQQIAYLAAKRWGRLHAPDVILGVYTPDEIEEMVPANAAGPHALPRNAPPATVAKAAAEQTRPERTPAHVKIIETLEHTAFKEGTEGFRVAWEALSKGDRAAIGIEERDRIKAIGAETDERVAKGVAP